VDVRSTVGDAPGAVAPFEPVVIPVAWSASLKVTREFVVQWWVTGRAWAQMIVCIASRMPSAPWKVPRGSPMCSAASSCHTDLSRSRSRLSIPWQ
jgi:hypothetical protein